MHLDSQTILSSTVAGILTIFYVIRRIMRYNHPDLGGSPFMSSKINEAKDLLAKRARSDPNYSLKMRKKQQRYHFS